MIYVVFVCFKPFYHKNVCFSESKNDEELENEL